MGMILRLASSRIVGQGDIVGRSVYFSLNLSSNSVMRGLLDARRTLKSLVADLRDKKTVFDTRRNICRKCRQGFERQQVFRIPISDTHLIEIKKRLKTAGLSLSDTGFTISSSPLREIRVTHIFLQRKHFVYSFSQKNDLSLAN